MRYERLRHCTNRGLPRPRSELLICEICSTMAPAAASTWADQVAAFVEEHNARHGTTRLRILVPAKTAGNDSPATARFVGRCEHITSLRPAAASKTHR